MYRQNVIYLSTLQRQADRKPCASMLVDAVSDIAKNVFKLLGSGLPKSVYQLMLCRQLAELGIMLESERLLPGLSHDEHDIIVLDRCVSIVCLAGVNSRQTIQGCQLALSSSKYDMALIIDFSDEVKLYPVTACELLVERH